MTLSVEVLNKNNDTDLYTNSECKTLINFVKLVCFILQEVHKEVSEVEHLEQTTIYIF